MLSWNLDVEIYEFILHVQIYIFYKVKSKYRYMYT